MSCISSGAMLFSAPFSMDPTSIGGYLSFFCWVKFPTTVTGAQGLVLVANSATQSEAGLFKANTGNQLECFQIDATGTQIFAANVATAAASTWYAVFGTVKFPTTTAFLSTQGSASASGSLGTMSWNQIQLMGRQINGGAAGSFINSGGMLAECAIWAGVPSSSEQTDLVTGHVCPWRIAPNNLICYVPLRMNAQDYGPYHLPFAQSASGGSFVGDHPIIDGMHIRSRVFLYKLSSTLYNKALSASQSEGLGLIKQTGARRGASSPEAVSRILSMSRAALVTSPESLSLSRAMAALRSFGAADAESASLAKRLLAVRSYSASTTEATTLARSSAKNPVLSSPQASILVRATGLIRGAVDAQVAGSSLTKAARRVFGATQSETTSEVGQTRRPRAFSAVDAQVASVVAAFSHAGVNTGVVLSAASTQVVATVRSISKLLGAGAAQAVSVARLVVRRPSLGTIATQTASLLRQPVKKLPVTGNSSGTLLKRVGVARSTSDPNTAGLVLLKSTLAIVAATLSQAVSLRRGVAHLLLAANPASAALSRAIGTLRATTSPQVVSRRLLMSRGIPLGQSMTVGTAPAKRARTMAQSIQSMSTRISYFGQPTILAGVISTQVVTAVRNYPRAFAVISRMAVDAVRWGHHFVPLALRRRVVLLPFADAESTLPRLVRRVVLPAAAASSTLAPAVRRVLLPREDEELLNASITRPEPDRFSPFDPTDEDQFTFDWSRRAYPNDAIVFASVTSTPAGVNFIGPAFIDGLLVEVTIGPFTPPTLPMTYQLRCRAVFASGRISNYSVPFVVMSL
jgi:hypothetical protein